MEIILSNLNQPDHLIPGRAQSELRTEQLCEKVRAEVKALHAQGIPPTHHRVRRVLPSGAMRQPKVTVAWHEALRELGLRP